MDYFQAPQSVPDSALLKRRGDLKFAQFAHLNQIVDELNKLAPALHAKVATTANITLAGTQTIDGIAVVAGDLVLVKDQSTGANNGLYVVKAGAWVRDEDLDEASEFVEGRLFTVADGTVNGNSLFFLDFTNPFVVGTTTATFIAVGGSVLVNTGKTFFPVAEGSGSITAGETAGTYMIGKGDALVKSGTGIATPVALMYITATEYPAIAGVTRTMRVKTILSVNDVAPTGDFTFGLYPVTRPASSGGTGLNIYTLGTVVSGSTVAHSAPGADSMTAKVSSDFAIPASGFYMLGIVTTATVAVDSHIDVNAALEVVSL